MILRIESYIYCQFSSLCNIWGVVRKSFHGRDGICVLRSNLYSRDMWWVGKGHRMLIDSLCSLDLYPFPPRSHSISQTLCPPWLSIPYPLPTSVYNFYFLLFGELFSLLRKLSKHMWPWRLRRRIPFYLFGNSNPFYHFSIYPLIYLVVLIKLISFLSKFYPKELY